eukprot:Nk52_evm1s2436 gene=Nk52_evmTU1s2436
MQDLAEAVLGRGGATCVADSSSRSDSLLGDYTRRYFGYDLGVQLVGSEEMREMNKTYRGKDYPTDVLSFASSLLDHEMQQQQKRVEEDEEMNNLGDLVIDVDTMFKDWLEDKGIELSSSSCGVYDKDSKLFGQCVKERFPVLVVHGFYHLIGFDHEEEEEAREMRMWETKTLQAFVDSSHHYPHLKLEALTKV